MKKLLLFLLLLCEFMPHINAQKGYENAIQVHLGAYDKSGGGGVEYIGGYRFNEHFFLGGNIGLGRGSFAYDYLCINSKVYFLKSNISPYFGLSIGGLSQYTNTSLPFSFIWAITPLISPSIGVCERTTDKIAVYMGISCNLTGPLITSEPPYKKIHHAFHINLGLQF